MVCFCSERRAALFFSISSKQHLFLNKKNHSSERQPFFWTRTHTQKKTRSSFLEEPFFKKGSSLLLFQKETLFFCLKNNMVRWTPPLKQKKSPSLGLLLLEQHLFLKQEEPCFLQKDYITTNSSTLKNPLLYRCVSETKFFFFLSKNYLFLETLIREETLCQEVLFCCSAVLLFCCSAVLLFCCSAVLLFCCSAVLLFCCSAVLLFASSFKRRRCVSEPFFKRRTALLETLCCVKKTTLCF